MRNLLLLLLHIAMGGLKLLLCYFFYFPLLRRNRSVDQDQNWGKLSHCWKELRLNFSEIYPGFLEEAGFYRMYH